MTEHTFYYGLLGLSLLVALLMFPILMLIPAPYGRHARAGFGPRLPSALGWVLMELPSALGMMLCYALGRHDRVGAVFLTLWLLHYLHRSLIFPFRRAGQPQPMPLGVALLGASFNLVNSYLNGRYLFTLGPPYPVDWLRSPVFLLGLLLFLGGMAINWHADEVLRRLRRPGETGYRIPYGGLYRFISCPNYFGELVEWTGWALLTCSPGGLCFALWTAANLLPRAHANHRWYKARFPSYPPERRAVLPGLW